MSNKTTEYLVLKDSHKTMQKLYKLFALAEELGISIEFEYCQHTTIKDEDFASELEMVDVDHAGECVSGFPPTFDYKARYRNPAYIKEREEASRKWHEEEEERRVLAELLERYPDMKGVSQ